MAPRRRPKRRMRLEQGGSYRGRRRRSYANLQGRDQSRGAIFDLVRRQGNPAGMAAYRQGGTKGGMSRLHRRSMDRHASVELEKGHAGAGTFLTPPATAENAERRTRSIDAAGRTVERNR